MLVNIQTLIDDAKCYEVVRQLRWPMSIQCPACGASEIVKRGHHTHQAHRQRYGCRTCGRQFDDLSGTIFEGHHQPSRVWVLCLYFMGLNLSNEQIAAELEVDADTVQGPCRAWLHSCEKAWWSKKACLLERRNRSR